MPSSLYVSQGTTCRKHKRAFYCGFWGQLRSLGLVVSAFTNWIHLFALFSYYIVVFKCVLLLFLPIIRINTNVRQAFTTGLYSQSYRFFLSKNSRIGEGLLILNKAMCVFYNNQEIIYKMCSVVFQPVLVQTPTNSFKGDNPITWTLFHISNTT